MKNFIFRIPQEIHIGFSHRQELEMAIIGKNSNILLVVDYHVKELGLIDDIFDVLTANHIGYTVFDRIREEPTVTSINDGLDLMKSIECDAVICVGGGSVIDTAKILAIGGSIEGSIGDYLGGEISIHRRVPIIAIPTTSGTGAEVTPNAIIKDEEDQCKKGLVHPSLIPDKVIIDVGLTLSLPPRLTAETGLDAFTHAIECYISKKSNPLSDLYALEAIRLISSHLIPAVRDGMNKEHRYNMALGSLYGGVALTNSGVGGVHALAYPLGGKYGIGHGLSNAVLLAEVMDYNRVSVLDKFAVIAEAMGIPEDNDREVLSQRVVATIRNMVADLDVRLERLEINPWIIEDLAKSALTVKRLLINNPRPIDHRAAKMIYEKSLIKD